MLDSLRNFVADLTGGQKHPARFEENDYRLAAAALLIHASTNDGDMTPAERGKLHDLLKSRFALDETAISVASRVISFSRRETSAISWPLRANTRASDAPMPTDAPVMTVTGLKIELAIPRPRTGIDGC